MSALEEENYLTAENRNTNEDDEDVNKKFHEEGTIQMCLPTYIE